MFSDSKHGAGLFRFGCAAVLLTGTLRAGDPTLRVCADPDNLPYSNRDGQGFENKLAQLVAHDLGRRVEYFWWPQRQTFLRNSLRANRCDVVMGVGAGAARLQTTRPYYRSTFVFVTRRDGQPALHSLDDERLRRMRIGIHLVGDDYASVPPAQGLAKRGMIQNIAGYTIYGNAARQNPRAPLIDAVATGKVDVAIVWGPIAGYFAKAEPTPLEITRIKRGPPDRSLPFSFDIAMAVRPADEELRRELDRALARRRVEIRRLLRDYGVPLSEPAGGIMP